MRLIDADAFKQRNERLLQCDFPYKSEETLEELIDSAPIIEERKKGKWSIEETNTYELSYGVTAYAPVYKCSACGRSIESHLMLDEPIVPEDANFSRFCPWCGANMIQENDNG